MFWFVADLRCADPTAQLSLKQHYSLPSTMPSEQDRSETSSPTKKSIIYLPCSQLSCDPIVSATSEQRLPNYACFELNSTLPGVDAIGCVVSLVAAL